MSAPSAPVRISFGLPVALVGAILALVGFLGLDWGASADFFDARTAVGDHGGRFNPFTQVYFLVLWLPLLVITVALGVVVTVGPAAARVGTSAAGIIGGLSLIGLALVAALAHLAIVNDLFADNSDADFGAWAPAIGFALLAVAASLPYRRPAFAAPPPPAWSPAGYGR